MAFIDVVNEGEASVDSLESTGKLNRFKDSAANFFKSMARGLGNLIFPQSMAAGPIGAAGTTSGGSAGVMRVAGHDPLDIEPFEPLDLQSLKPVDFESRFNRLLPESYSWDSLPHSLAPVIAGSGFMNPVILSVAKDLKWEDFVSLLSRVPQLAASPLTLAPSLLLDSFQAPSLEKPVLYSELRDQNLKSLREAFPAPDASPSPLLGTSFPEEATPFPSSARRSPTPLANTAPSRNPFPSPRVSQPPISPGGEPASPFGGRNPQSNFTPLIWDGLASLRIRENAEQKQHKKKPWIAQRLKQKTVYPIRQSLENRNNFFRTHINSASRPSISFPPSPQELPARVEAEHTSKPHSESVISSPRPPPFK